MVKLPAKRRKHGKKQTKVQVITGSLLIALGLILGILWYADASIYVVTLPSNVNISYEKVGKLSLFSPYVRMGEETQYLLTKASSVEVDISINGTNYKKFGVYPIKPGEVVNKQASVTFTVINPSLINLYVRDNLTNTSLPCCVVVGPVKNSAVQFRNYLLDLPLTIFMVYDKLVATINSSLNDPITITFLFILNNKTVKAFTTPPFKGVKTYSWSIEYDEVIPKVFIHRGFLTFRLKGTNEASLHLSDNPVLSFLSVDLLTFTGILLILLRNKISRIFEKKKVDT